MELSQVKLTKKEWQSVEIPVSENEKEILQLIQEGFEDINIKYNPHKSLFSFLKIVPTPEMEYYLYTLYFEKEVQSILKSAHDKSYTVTSVAKNKMPKKADMMRLNNLGVINQENKNRDLIFEFVLLDICRTVSTDVPYCVYTLNHLLKATISNTNQYVINFCKYLVAKHSANSSLFTNIILHSYKIIEKNAYLLNFADRVLYDHQKRLFQVFREPSSDGKLVLYTAPTGTGKTLSPLGLAKQYKVIYICAARHIGLALAKSAITMEKAVAFAFGCETASDIRLHYYAAVEYTRNKRSGGIGKVDNSNGTKVEIMICDVASYLIAMYYMLSFHQEENIIMYWDEPTISLDVAEHPLHDQIHKLWADNKISKVVLSSATLPKEIEMLDMIDDFRDRFSNVGVFNITSVDCKKTISLLDANGMCVLPHLQFAEYADVMKCVNHISENKVILKYLDLQEIVRFIEYVESGNFTSGRLLLNECFETIDQIHMQSIKELYIEMLRRVDASKWHEIHLYMKTSVQLTPNNVPKSSVGGQFGKTISVDAGLCTNSSSVQLRRLHSCQEVNKVQVSTQKSGVLLTTDDAHTLTDGPAIFLVEDVEKLGKFYLQQTKLPKRIIDNMMDKIGANNQIQKRMEILMKSLDDAMGSEADKDKKMEKESFKPEVRKIMNSIEALRGEITSISMEPVYIPNTRQHQNVWLKDGQTVDNAFIPYIDEVTVKSIMELDVDTNMKILLLLGIGVFTNSKEQDTSSKVEYMEIMKRLSQEQKLYLIIASSDYIYGTNYQLCHAFLGKDLLNMTQQKIIQAMGRVGRQKIQQDYTVRFRDNSLLNKLLLPAADLENLEALNICKLFVR